MDAEELVNEKAKLKPGEWLDYLPDPLETVADIEDLFRCVRIREAELKAEAISKASLN
jgi:hypothetical protein